MKRKSMATLIGGLLSVCLIGVGFASWIIVQDDTDTLEGTVHVETVTDNSVYIEASWESGVEKDSFNFTAPASATTGWLISDTENTEKLSLNAKIVVKNADREQDGVIDVDWNTSSLSGYSKYVEAIGVTGTHVNGDGDIVIPTYDAEAAHWSEAEGVHVFTTTITLSFKWGSNFKLTSEDEAGVNPYQFYNSKEASGYTGEANCSNPDAADKAKWTWAQEAQYVLTELSKASSATTTLTLTAQAKRTAA